KVTMTEFMKYDIFPFQVRNVLPVLPVNCHYAWFILAVPAISYFVLIQITEYAVYIFSFQLYFQPKFQGFSFKPVKIFENGRIRAKLKIHIVFFGGAGTHKKGN